MSKLKSVRTGLLGSAAAFALIGTATTAQAVEAQFGDVQIVFDTTVSMGASMLTQSRMNEFLPEANGGPVDPRNDASLGGVVLANGIFVVPAPGPGAVGFNGMPQNGVLKYSGNVASNHDGSINADDGRLNFDRGDIIGANVKASHDLQISWQNYKIFARAVGFYDVVMNDPDVGAHSQLTDRALGDVGRNYELLDLFVSADYMLGDVPLNLRVGKQVINWGESTFLQNGLNAFNPIDVAAIRRPGSELKEALVPVNAVFGSVSLPFDVSVAGYYALDWEPFELDPSGTPFSGADAIAYGSGIGGNNSYNFVTASPFGGNRRNCVAPAGSGTNLVQTSGLLNDPTPIGGPVTGNSLLECFDEGSPYISHLVRLPNGLHEAIRIGQINGAGGQANLSGEGVTASTTSLLLRGDDTFARDANQYGLKATWFAESLNGTEFGFYYQNYHSRLPFVSVKASPTDTMADLSFFLNSDSTNLPSGRQSRELNNAGCGLTSPFQTGTIGLGGFVDLDPGLGVVAPAGFSANAAIGSLGSPTNLILNEAADQMANTPVSDPGNILPTAATSPALGAVGMYFHPTFGYKNQLAVAQLNCALTYHQSAVVLTPTGATVQSFDGAEFVLSAGDGTIALSYPEDIEMFGFSFNSTIGSWGIQGEMSYRPNAPFQVDTDSLTIASLVNGCIFTQLYGAVGPVLGSSATPDGSGVRARCGDSTRDTVGVLKNEMFTAQVGTTATFTGSEWFIEAVGADLGVMVTEAGMVYVPSVEDTWIDDLPSIPVIAGIPTRTPGVKYKQDHIQYQNTGCQGTDLPLAGALALDVKSSSQCRPNDLSAGLVMLFSLQYNNFMDTGFVLSPTLVYSYDFEGTTPSPYGNYMEDRQAVNLGLNGSLNNNFRMGVSYSNFFGGHVNNKSRDRDFASFTASYTF